ELTDSTISIDPQRLQFAHSHETTVVPPQVQDALLPNFQVDIDAAELPFTVTPTDLVVTSGRVVPEGTAADVRFADLSLQNSTPLLCTPTVFPQCGHGSHPRTPPVP